MQSAVTLRRGGLLALLLSLAACQGPGPLPGPVIAGLPDVAGPDAAQPHLALDARGNVLMSWLRQLESGYALEFALLEDGAWSTPQRIATGTDWFINWADFPSVVPLDENRWLAHWLVRLPDSYAYNVVTARSEDSGQSFSTPAVLNEDGTETEHGFVTLFPWEGGAGAVWLDGRRLHEWTFEKELAAEIPLGVSLYYQRTDAAGSETERAEIDELVCDCCQPDVAVTAQGPVLVYRDRTPDEIRDIVARRYVDGAWSPPVAVGRDDWEIDGCPVNGPTLAARGEHVAVAWFTAPGNEPAVRFARSSDAGASFAEAVTLDTTGSFGQTDVVLYEDLSAVVSWWRRHEDGGLALTLRRIEADGALGPLHTVAHASVTQPLDVPQMIASEDGLVLVWTGIDEQAGLHALRVSGL